MTASSTVPESEKSLLPATPLVLRYHVPPTFVAPQVATRNVTVVASGMSCSAVIVDKSINACGFPAPLVTVPQAIGDPMSVKVVPSVEYAHCPIDGPVAERRML